MALSFKGGFSFKIGTLTFIGLLLYMVSFLLWQKLLVTFDMSFIIPFTTGVVQVIVLLMALFYFKEDVSVVNIIGIFVIVVGVVLVTIK